MKLTREEKSKALSATVDTIEQSLKIATGVQHSILLVTHDQKTLSLHLHGNVGRQESISLLEGALDLARSLTNENDPQLN